MDDHFQRFLVVDVEAAATLCLPSIASRQVAAVYGRARALTFLLQRLQPSSAPGFELLAHLIGVPIGCDDDMHMIRTAIDCVKSPASRAAMGGDGRLHESALFVIQPAGIFGHARGCLLLDDRIRWSYAVSVLYPSPFVTG
jgi:hypothetical protein